MTDELENNKVNDDADTEECSFTFNFISQPWTDRTNRSKIGIISLLIAIFVATMALVINNLVRHYRDFDSKLLYTISEIDCNLVKVDEYPYAARIHSISSNELICIGAVVSSSSVLANELCLKSGPIRLRLGNPVQPHCKKGFPIDIVDLIPHDGAITNSLVILTSLDNISDCIKPIKIGVKLDTSKQLNVIGRPFRGGRQLSFQLAECNKANESDPDISSTVDKNKTICVQTFGKCPVRAGDLLIQQGRLLGLASTSVHRKDAMNSVCFANLRVINNKLKALGVDIEDM